MTFDSITSFQNPKVKDLTALIDKSKERRERKLFVVEGKREVTNCLKGGFQPVSVFFCQDIISSEETENLFSHLNTIEDIGFFSVTGKIYEKLAYRGSTEGIIAVMREIERPLSSISLGENPFVIVLESVEKPGNLGAVLRTADASGSSAVLICDPLTDLYNPNLIRASMGGIFTLQVAACTSEDAYNWLKNNGLNIMTAQLQDSVPYYNSDMSQGTAVVFGAESTGLSDFWRKRSDSKIMIPMLGVLDSLNVSASVSVLAYEAVRQKMNKR